MEMRVHGHLAKKTIWDLSRFSPFVCVWQGEGHMMQWIVSIWYNLLMHKEVKWYSFSIVLKYFVLSLETINSKWENPLWAQTQIAKFMGPTWVPPGSCRPQMGPMLASWTLLSGEGNKAARTFTWSACLSGHCMVALIITQGAS